ncbi:hypothetical protein [Dyadobacter bucti]|uniref:hypothetical protein n=1 Tax=Dyadobacter bucti TaxID=2572203 RepID=UPI0011082E54|nr:hypothetical protein [Dyadobacter bucti]
MKCTLLKVFLTLLIVLPTCLLRAQTGCDNLPGDKYFGKAKITVKLDYLSNIPETDVPFDRWFYLQKKVPSSVRISDVAFSEPVQRGGTTNSEILCFDQKPIKDDEGYDSVTILIPPLNPNSRYELAFLSNLDDGRKQKFLEVFLSISANKPDTTLKLYRLYGQEKKNRNKQPTISDLKNYYDQHLKEKITKYESETNEYSKGLIKKEIFDILDKSALKDTTRKMPAFEKSLLTNKIYLMRLTSILIDYYIGNTEEAYLRFKRLHFETNTTWTDFEKFVKHQLNKQTLLTETDSTNLTAETINSSLIITAIRDKIKDGGPYSDWQELISVIEDQIAKNNELANVSSCLAWDKIREAIHIRIAQKDQKINWQAAEQFLDATFADYAGFGCEKYGRTRKIISDLAEVNKEVEVTRTVDIFRMASTESLGVQNFDFKTRNSYRLVPDFGYVVYGFRPGTFFGGSPYVGVAYNLRSFDPDIPLNKIRSALAYHEYLSFNIGLAFSSVAKTDYRDDLLGNRNLLTGMGIRVTQGVKINLGTLWYNRLDDNPLIDRKKVRGVFYLGFSLDFRLQELLGDFAGIFSGNFLPKGK